MNTLIQINSLIVKSITQKPHDLKYYDTNDQKGLANFSIIFDRSWSHITFARLPTVSTHGLTVEQKASFSKSKNNKRCKNSKKSNSGSNGSKNNKISVKDLF